MKCPLNKATTYFDGKEYQVVMADCLKEECAWWEERFKKCCVAVPAYLSGNEDVRKEAKALYDNR